MTLSIGDQSLPVLNLNGFTVSFNFSEAFNDASLSAEFNDNNWLSAEETKCSKWRKNQLIEILT